MVNFAETLKTFFEKENLTPQIFAEKIGANLPQVRSWLSGRSKPRYQQLQRICRAFPNISANYWLGISCAEKPH